MLLHFSVLRGKTVLGKLHQNTLGPLYLLAILLCLNNCVMKQAHYDSMLELSNQASLNYSQQILNAIVGIRENAEMPTLYYVEAGQSSWGKNLSGSMLAQMSPPWNTNRTMLQPSGSTGENLNLSLQLNDFGPAAMSRVTAIYVFLCYPIHVGGGRLPNGALYTVVDKSSSPAPFILSTRSKEGYYGITEETRFEFFKITRDITYWTRHADPKPSDLESAAGLLYSFFAQYPSTEMQLANMVVSASKAETDFEGALDDYGNQFKVIAQLVEDAKKAGANDKIYVELLKDAYAQRDFKYMQMAGAFTDRKNKKNQLQELEQQVFQLLDILKNTVIQIKHVDPQGDLIDVDAILQPFYDRIDGIIHQDQEVLKLVRYQMPSTSSLDAQDSIDKLYRDRFEALPQQFDNVIESLR